jgi:hypothetical protein
MKRFGSFCHYKAKARDTPPTVLILPMKHRRQSLPERDVPGLAPSLVLALRRQVRRCSGEPQSTCRPVSRSSRRRAFSAADLAGNHNSDQRRRTQYGPKWGVEAGFT